MNDVTSKTHEELKKIPLMEIFGPTIQGEGVLCGVQTYFMRFGLCDYKCTSCDSMHAVDPIRVHANAKWLNNYELADEFLTHLRTLPQPQRQFPVEWMTFSGGNPCIHNLKILTHKLHSLGLKINVETQGTYCPEWLADVDMVTISPKTPGMGAELNLDKVRSMVTFLASKNVEHIIKFVVFNQQDLEVVAGAMDELNRIMPDPLFYLSLGNPYPPGSATEKELMDTSPTAEIFEERLRNALLKDYRILCEDILSDTRFRRVVFLPQLHVLVWGNKAAV